MPDFLTPDQFDALRPPPGTVVPPPTAPAGELTPDQFDALQPPSVAGTPVAPVPSLAHEAGTAIYNGLGSILSTPRMVEHTKNWLEAQAGNAVTGDNKTGADLDANDPAMKYLPDQNSIYRLTGTKPTTAPSGAGQLAQNAVSGGIAAAVDPLSDASTFLKMVKQAVPGVAAGAGATVAQNVGPDNPLTPVIGGAAAALLTHGAGTAASTVAVAGRPYVPFRPGAATDAAQVAAGRDLAGAAGTVQAPTAADLATAATLPQQAGNDLLGPGANPTEAMGSMRDTLAARQGQLSDARDVAAAPAYAAFRAEPAVPPENVRAAGLTTLPAFAPALRSAGTDMRNLSLRPLVSYPDFNVAGDTVMQPGGLTPDLLDRTHTKLGTQAANARNVFADGGADGQKAAGLSAASSKVTDFLDQQFPNTYPQARQAFADASAPLAPFKAPAVAAALDRAPTSYGTPGAYTLPAEGLLDHIAASKTPGSVMQQFITAAGGDKASVAGPIKDAIVGKLRQSGAIDPITGEIDPKAFAAQTRQYMPTLSMFMPDVADSLGTVKQAQSYLDSTRAQAATADAITGGALKDATGNVTAESIGGFLGSPTSPSTAAKAMLAHDPNGYMFLRSLQQQIKETKGAPNSPIARAIYGAVPAVVGAIAGRIPVARHVFNHDGAVLGAILGEHYTPEARQALINRAYGDAISRAVVDPVKRQEFQAVAKRTPGYAVDRAAVASRFLSSLPAATRQGLYSASGLSLGTDTTP